MKIKRKERTASKRQRSTGKHADKGKQKDGHKMFKKSWKDKQATGKVERQGAGQIQM